MTRATTWGRKGLTKMTFFELFRKKIYFSKLVFREIKNVTSQREVPEQMSPYYTWGGTKIGRKRLMYLFEWLASS